jgi:uncharacterized protein (TIGR02996 family)
MKHRGRAASLMVNGKRVAGGEWSMTPYQPTDDEAAFRAAICAAPADDMPRLVFADWLSEHGQGDRAEFIRAQIRLATIPAIREANAGPGGIEWIRSLVRQLHDTGPDHPALVEDNRLLAEHGTLLNRMAELFEADPARTLSWFELPQPWANIVRLTPFDFLDADYPFAIPHRGFLHRVCCDADVWIESGDIAKKRHPITHVTWTRFDAIARDALMRRVLAACVRDINGRLFTDLAAEVWKGIQFDLPLNSICR